MQEELSQAELDQIFYGKKPKKTARFWIRQILDPSASKEAGMRIMKDADYVDIECKRENVFVSRMVQDQDKREFPVEWAAFQKEKEDHVTGTGKIQDIHTAI
jgi:hypothetical protein